MHQYHIGFSPILKIHAMKNNIFIGDNFNYVKRIVPIICGKKQNTGQYFLGTWQASETLYLFSFTKLMQVHILEEVKVILKPSIWLGVFIWK